MKWSAQTPSPVIVALPPIIKYGAHAAREKSCARRGKRKMSNPFDQMVQNQKTVALKKFLVQILEGKYPPYDDIISRMGHHLITDNDYASFGKMLSEIYEAGYLKAVAEYREQLAKLNIRVNVTQKTLGGSQK
jgi:hypothetical protein